MDFNTSNPNPNPSEQKLAFHFLTALARINQTSTPSSSPQPRRSRSIQRAAYASMAYAAGPRRAWSRALLRRILGRRRSGVPPHLTRRAVLIRRRLRVARPRPRDQRSRADSLRRLVPGGEGMNLCSLLDETAHYIQSLSAQVQLMQTLVDSASH